MPRIKIYPPIHVQVSRQAELERLKNDPDSDYFDFNPKKKLRLMKMVFNMVRVSHYQYRILSFPEECNAIPIPIYKKIPRDDPFQNVSLFRYRYLSHITEYNSTMDGRLNLDKYLKTGKNSSKYIIQYINACLCYFKILKRRILKNGDITIFIDAHNIMTFMNFITGNTYLKYDEMIDLFAIDILNFNPKEHSYYRSCKELRNARYFVVYNLRSKLYQQRLFIYVHIPEKEYDTYAKGDIKRPFVYPYNKYNIRYAHYEKKIKEPIAKIDADIYAHFNEGKDLEKIKQEKEEEKQYWMDLKTARKEEQRAKREKKANTLKKMKLFEMQSLNAIFKSANWCEREIWDMYGIYFKNHRDLRRLLTDYTFIGSPLRKDFPLTGFKEISYNETKKTIVSSKVELAQDFRNFEFNNPWKL